MIAERAKRVGLKELAIFDYFIVDTNLPKHRKDNDKSDKYDDGIGVSSNEAWATVPQDPSINGIVIGSNGSIYYGLSRWSKIKLFLIRKLEGKSKEKVLTKTISITEYFTNLSKSFKELTPIADIAKHYENALVQANTMGQTALVQKLKDLVGVVRGEAQLIGMNLKKYVTEKQVLDFYEKVGEDKNLKLTWIKNFGRIIPEEIYEVKKDVDERKIFDNYVILHYDPENNGEKMTKQEIEDKKDPIIFGLIKDSRKLYYVADWKDDYCELTLEEMFQTLGKKTLQINNKNVKTFIDKVKV